MKVNFVKSEEVAQGIRTFWFEPENHPNHIAGQYAHWTLKHENADDRGEKRWFTISASPTEAPLISITTKHAAEKGSSFKESLFSMEPGTELNFNGPLGDFVLPKDESRPLIFVAGGIGCTPYRSIAKFLADSNQKRDIHLIYAVSRSEEIAFKDLFEKAYPRFDLVVGEKLTGQKILDLAGGVNKQLFFFSGPEPMVEGLVKQCKDLGLPDSQIVLDYFPGYQDI